MKINKKEIIIFLIIFLFSSIIFVPYYLGHFATDTYNIYDVGYEQYAINWSLHDGRIFMFIITIIAGLLKLPITVYTSILSIFSVFVSSIIVIILKNIVIQYKKDVNLVEEILITIASYYTIFNFMYIENMYFAECFVMALSLLFYLLSAKCIVDKKSKYIIKSTIFMILAIMSYQGTISMFFIALFVFTLLKEKDIKKIIKNIFICIGVAIIGIIINYLGMNIIAKITQREIERGFDINIIISSISTIISRLERIIVDTGYLFYKYIYLLFLLIIEIIVLIKSILKKDIRLIIEQILIIIASISSALVISIMSETGFWSGRIRFAIGATIGFLFIHLLVKTDLQKNNNIINNSLIIIFLIYGLINSINYIQIIYTNKKVNEYDKQIALEIGNYIKQYEKENSINVKNIAIVKEVGTINAYYKTLNYKNSVIASSAIRTDWSIKGIIKYYNNIQLEQQKITQKERQNYIQTVEDNKKYECIGQTLYITTYMH